MRKSLLLSLLACFLVAADLSAQFVSEILVSDRRHRPVRPRLSPIVVERHSIKVEVRDGLAQTTVHQVFRNMNQFQLEGTYFFPLPDGAALQDFAMKMGDRMVKGEVLEKDKAATIYQGIVQRQRDPALLEYVGRRLFKARIFPIPARGTSEIELKYSESLRHDGSTVEFRYPFRTRNVSPVPVTKADFKLTIHSKGAIRTVYSPSHKVKVVKTGDSLAEVSFESLRDPADRDVVVVYGLSKKPVGATLFTHVEKGDEGSFLLLLAPSEEEGGEIAKKDVVFVVDTSGSMAGKKIEQTREALSYCINSMRPEDRFEIVPFSTEAQSLFGTLTVANKDSKERAASFVKDMVARGGTNIEEALTKALSLSRDKDRPFLVIFMTDGEPTIGVTRPADILKNVKKANEALTRLFVFGIGDDLNAELLDQLAEDNQGARDYVGNEESIELKISNFFQKVSSPVLADLNVALEGVAVTDMHPKKLPDLFRGSQIMLTGRFKGSGKATVALKGKLNGVEKEHRFEVTFKKGDDKTAYVSRLWAVRKVGYLMDQIRLHGVNPELKSEVVRLGKKYGIVTPYTSYLVVEDAVAAMPPTRRHDGRRGRDRGLRRSGGGRGGRWEGAPTPRTRSSPGEEPDADDARPADGAGVRPRASRAPEGLRVKADEFLGRPNKPQKAGGAAPTSPSGDKAEGKSKGAKGGYTKDFDTEVEESRKKAVDRFVRGFFSDSISVSRHVKELRESATAESGGAPLLVRRIGNRTFYYRNGFFIEASLLDLDAKAIKSRLVKVEAFSAEYMTLVAKRKELAHILALGDRLLFEDGKKVVQILPAGSLKKPEKTPEKAPATEPTKKK